MSIRRRVYDLPPHEKQRYESTSDEFDAAWMDHPGEPPSIETRLPADQPLRGLLLFALVKTDLECCLKQGEPTSAKAYFQRFPELDSDADARAELIEWERQLLSEAGTASWVSPPGFSRLERIGQGSMGVVFRAWDDKLKRSVALKFLFPILVPDAVALARLRKEAEIVASLNHPNVVAIHRVCEHEGRSYCVFEFCSGGSIHERLSAGPLDPDEAARLIATVGRGVQAAHDAGVIHRDLKPANILFNAVGTPKVADFGLARRVSDPTLTGSGDVLGTICYAAPEQLSKGEGGVTSATDVYALGSTLYHCLTGRPPFVAATVPGTYALVMRGDLVSPSRMAAVPRDLDCICLKCLAMDPRRRYASAAELTDDLERYLVRKPIRARPPSIATRIRLWCRRNPSRAVASGLGAAALLVITGLAITFGNHQRRTAGALQVALSIATYNSGRQLCEKGDVGHGLLVLADALQSVPDGPENSNLKEALRIELAGWHRQCHTIQHAFEHPRKVLALAISTDGSSLITGCADGKVRLWDLGSGQCRWTGDGHEQEIRSVAFDPCGSLFLTGGADARVFAWDAASRQRTGVLEGHRGPISSVAISPDGRLALTGSEDGEARLWDLSTRRCRRIVPHDYPVQTVGFSPDGNHFFTGGGKPDIGGFGEFRLYGTPADGEEEPSFRKRFAYRVRSAAIMASADGITIVVGDDNWGTTFFDATSQQFITATDYARGKVRAVVFAEDGRTALIGAEDSNTALLYDVAALREHWKRRVEERVVPSGQNPPGMLPPALPHPQPVTAVSFVPPDEKTFATACEDGYVRVWRKAPGPSKKVLPHNPRKPSHEIREYVVWATAIDSSGQLAATAGEDGRVLLWDVSTGRQDGSGLDCRSPVKSVAFTSNGESIVTGAKDGRVRIWDRRNRKERGAPILHEGGVSGVSISRVGDLVLVGGAGVARLWEVTTRMAIGRAFWHGEPGISLATAIAPSNDRFLTVAEDGNAKLWAMDGALIWEANHPNQEIRGASFTRDGHRVVTASDDGTARVWDVMSGQPLVTLTHESEVFSAIFTPDDRVLTSSREGAQVWDLELRRRVGPSFKYRNDILCIACSVDGKTAVLADWDGYGVIWCMPEPMSGDPTSIIVRLQSELGMKLDGEGGRQVMSGSEWLEQRARYCRALPVP